MDDPVAESGPDSVLNIAWLEPQSAWDDNTGKPLHMTGLPLFVFYNGWPY